MSQAKKTVMISSTARDLPQHRKEVMDACLRQGMYPVMMEHLPANDDEAIAVSLRMVDEADVYVGVFAHRLAGRMWWSFYGSDATFENFVTRALTYTTQRLLAEVERVPKRDREAQLLRERQAILSLTQTRSIGCWFIFDKMKSPFLTFMMEVMV
jgi:hypothetical protein